MKRVFGVGLALAGALGGAHALAAERSTPAPPLPQKTAGLRALARADLRVTLGELAQKDGALFVESPKFRAVARGGTPQRAELDFTYLGPTSGTAPLASGALRRQLGLKLRAEDGCNLVYVMWRIEPRPQLVVSIKRNPGATTHAQCGAGGYTNVRPLRRRPLPRLEAGGRHRLQVELEGQRLVVKIDGVAAWEGELGAESLAFDGPVGLRTDNVRVAFHLRVP